ncbi:hypothetical protein [Sulfolobus sp. S-194]|nr:hypothetical protein [Sulfolobus sp. S-194]
MSRMGLAIVLLIFGATAAMIGFLVYTILWDSSPIREILPLLLR